VSARVQLRARVPDDLGGLRLDQALARMFPEHSRARLQGWIKDGAVRIDGMQGRARDPVAGGESVELDAALPASARDGAEAIPLRVVHSDEALFVIDKPPGLTVHPGAGQASGTLLNALLHLDPELARVPRAGLVHRLDKDTSGLLVVARTAAAHTALVAALAKRDFDREYETVVVGKMLSGGRVDAPIGRHPVNRTRMCVREDGRHAVTHYRVIERFRVHSHVACKLETGRTHQIRVHLAHVGYPIVGDRAYGNRLSVPRGATPALAEQLRATKRQMLHARRLGLAHPLSGARLEFESPTPSDITALLQALRDDAREGKR
jgi:23S rRNA pseudouridine1911/1915/1917 synthase